MKLKFLGASGTVTGSSYLLTSSAGETILIDCGLFQGDEALERQNFSQLACDCTQLLGVVLTHSHLDHCGRLPLLPTWGFHQTIWMIPPTRDITEISLYDTAKINTKEEGARRALYGKDQVDAVLSQFQTVSYGEIFSIGSFDIRFFDAGHILGSACVEVTDKSSPDGSKKIVFSGDLGNTPEDLIQPTAKIPAADFIVMESTYGDRLHPTGDINTILSHEVEEIEKNGGALLIPVFSIQRTQELLHIFAHLKKDGRIPAELPIFVDSPMAQKVTQVFGHYPDYFNEEFRQEYREGDPFAFPGLTMIRDIDESRQIDATAGAKIILAGSGMMAGGRILNHSVTYLPLPTTRLLFVGYQAADTLGRQIMEGQRDVVINGVPVKIQATVSDTQIMSSHADQPKLINWLGVIKGVKKVFITHGDDEARSGLSAKITSELKLQEIFIPALNQEYEL